MPDGQMEGNLNFAATRLGWTRSLSLPAEKVETMSYATLESILELNTLKIRAMSLRIFIEHPPASGNFVRVRPWKDDGALQSILMKAFFVERMKNGITTNLDIRDGNVREPDVEGKDILGAREWLKTHGLIGTKSNPSPGGEPEEREGDETTTPVVAGNGLLSALGFGRAVPSKFDDNASDGGDPQEKKSKTEEDILREQGWGPPLMRRLTGRQKRKPKVPIEEKDILEEGDGEEIEVPEAQEANGGARPPKNALWRKGSNAFLGKKTKKGGVEVVKTPSDAIALARQAVDNT
ncbi:hypothetical protein BDP27DRAFT_1412481 [Rhodocollybia butyracea]|uniref:Uncharacterized protein n=1 Tax=Rhodocollybia butyracea TaxID=206335 RepID=A0A9P5UGK3_9AGAR|nr:hypothetical protein BDP27DRAFT_1412481 [Rhodocollybia butyracea]